MKHIAFVLSGLAVLPAGVSAQTSPCTGLSGAAKGLCNAAVAAGCTTGTGSATACQAIADAYVATVGSTPPWLTSSTNVFLRFEIDYLDLETGGTCFGENPATSLCTVPPNDLHLGFNATQTNPTVLVQVQICEVEPLRLSEIAHLDGRSFDTVTSADIATSTFTTDIVDVPFDSDDTVILLTCDGSYFKIGNAQCFVSDPTSLYPACSDPATSPLGDLSVSLDYAAL
jgi:hypothetical protein